MHEMNESINQLHNIFDALNEKYFDGMLEQPIITVQANKSKGVYGWCTTQKVWESKDKTIKKYEINICGENLSRSVLDIACTIQHENCHLHNIQNGIKDVSANGKYHTKRFKKTAESNGLIISESKGIGWSVTAPSDEFKEFIKSLNIPEDAFNIYRICESDKDGKEKTKKPRKPKVEWTCSCGIVIKSKKDDLNVICGDCNQKFVKKVTEGLDGEDDGE